ncbi:tripartite tricarboxylate transporter TctB family protein [Marivita hallyeonensis]|uniref:Tripartite tricarboxylate transporter TctB family protein n=1 Tax=Marivita hallyeonensis TaxID=996342 RepID=A0A1M5PK77_9RHOB|nr:tripartite tricarboxylate transporter TctB family protein [Marivita hallyeonensis]SHH02194.1 Tripartite tricarboxylate transporter TctB family protein [Marivita hallyeonensis]
MTTKSLHLRIGIATVLGAAFLTFYAIPTFVFSPSNVSNIVLAPTFWPYVLSGLTGIVGVGFLATSFFSDLSAQDHSDEPDIGPGLAPWLRLAALASIMALMMYGLPRLGMVWTSMIAFVACAFLFRTRHPYLALVCAVIVPLLLYAFFAHVAGVAVPQGNFVRLP